MSASAINLNDKYTVNEGKVFITGTQALVRLPMMQQQRDKKSGLKTNCYISGYRGSPLGGYDKALWQAKSFLQENNIHFNPGVNEDLAATAIWGTQQINLSNDSNYDGVYSIWYGKGPGVDRSIDVFKHANNAGSAKYGGVLAIAGDDHVCASSTLPHQSEYDFAAAHMPVLNPAGVQEFIDFGLIGWGMSRYSGLWCSMVCIAETLDSSAMVSVDPHQLEIFNPNDFKMPIDGLNIRWPDPPMDQEARLHEFKLDAALSFARVNKIDRKIFFGSRNRRIGIVTTGKAYLDVRQALEELNIDGPKAENIGLCLYKVGMVWPLEPQGLKSFCKGLDEVLVVEEKRGFIEDQLRSILYNLPESERPRITGKKNIDGSWLIKSAGEIDPPTVIRALALRFGNINGFSTAIEVDSKLKEQKSKIASLVETNTERTPYFCSGCPHNSSTKVPDGSKALAGIGCHYMAQWMDRDTETYTHMGGEGANWIGQAPFVKTKHVFQNIGDGTYFHSGILAIRAAVAANVNITYKILYNDAVAMTGGQPMDGPFSAEILTQQIAAEGVKRIVVVSDEPHKYSLNNQFANGVTIHHRDDLDIVQRDLRTSEGVSALIYDQVCATEKRRRRKRGQMSKAEWRVAINPDVCEGCGDCGLTSNCLSLEPLETDLGRKRSINQSSCNMDYSCINGFCPSFVLIKGGELRKSEDSQEHKLLQKLPTPTQPDCMKPYGILIAGVGGMGVVTLAAIIGTAARIDNKGATVLDKAGLAQKYGAVTSHIRIAQKSESLYAVRIANGGANLLLGADLLVSSNAEILQRLRPNHSKAVVNSSASVTGDFTRNPNIEYPHNNLENNIVKIIGKTSTQFFNATQLATAIIGDEVYTNMFLLGHAYQKGFVPISGKAIEQAIRLNNVSIESNLLAFQWGRAIAVYPEMILNILNKNNISSKTSENSLEKFIKERADDLSCYQNANYSNRFTSMINRVQDIENRLCPGNTSLTEAVAKSYYKLLAYKDEYEIARLYTDGRFNSQINKQFQGKFSLHFHLAPPLLASRDPLTGNLKKRLFGPSMILIFKLIKHLKFLRGSYFDIFGWSQERKTERKLILEYEHDINTILKYLTFENLDAAINIAKLPLNIRGFGHIKLKNVGKYYQDRTKMLKDYNGL